MKIKLRTTRYFDPNLMGCLGGRATAAKRTPEERRSAAAKANRSRWEKYYERHPEKRPKKSISPDAPKLILVKSREEEPRAVNE